MSRRHRHRHLPAAALATLALALPAASQNVKKGPETLLYIDLATHDMPGMPSMGGLGKMAMGMFGRGGHNTYGSTEHPAMPGQYMDVTLRNSLNPGGTAADAVPGGLRLGDSLPLLAPKPQKSEPVERTPQFGGKPPDAAARILIYWGCGTDVRAGQPKVFEVSSKDGKVKVSGSMQGRYVPDRDPRTGPDTALWPNDKDTRSVPEGASIAGDHHVTGDRVPESLKFALGQAQDFMPKIALAHAGDMATGQTWRWQPVANARGYFLSAMGMQGDTLVLWSSSETSDAGMGLMDYLPNATVDKWIREKVLLAPTVGSCAIPKGIFAGKDGNAAAGMLQMIAYGPETNLSWPPKPKDPKIAWDPEWNVRVRTKSTAMAMLGMDFGAAMQGRDDGDDADGARQEQPAEPRQDKPNVKSLLKGLLGR
jgi:hypothetical protein